jgi:hypothetical protein
MYFENSMQMALILTFKIINLNKKQCEMKWKQVHIEKRKWLKG